MTPFPDVAEIGKGETVDVVVHADFGHAAASRTVRAEVATDRGRYPLALECPAEEAVRPAPLDFPSFEAGLRSLSGLNQSQSSFEVSYGNNEYPLVPQRAMECMHLAQVMPPGPGYTETGLLCYSGIIPAANGGGERVYVKIQLNMASGQGTIQMHCDSVVHCSSLLGVMKRAIAPS
ncbi:unnamed protein product [Heterosigma akashiwo]